LPTRFQQTGKPETEEEILAGFGVRFMYTNTVPALEQREIQKVDVTTPVYVVLGKMSAWRESDEPESNWNNSFQIFFYKKYILFEDSCRSKV